MKKILLFLFAACFLCSGCLKKDNYFDKQVASPVVRIPNSNWPLKSPYDPPAQDSALGTTILNLYAGIAFEKALDKDVKVVFKKDNAIAEDYSNYSGNLYGLFYTPLPDNCFTINSLELTIPAGSTMASLPVTIIPANFSGVDNYIISFSIQSSTDNTVAENFKTMVFTLGGY